MAPGPASDPTGERDWFGFPVERPRQPVPCPRCDEAFTDRRGYADHLRTAHGVQAAGRRPAPVRDQPALGRNRRSALSRRLGTIPLVLVVMVNVALILIVLGGMAAVGPAWWDDLMAQPWGQVVVVPLLWPTIVFLALRGVD